MGKRILLVTDLWFTHPNGVATVVSHLQKALEKKGHFVEVLEPSRFFSIAFPLYPEMRLALFAFVGMRRYLQGGNFDYIHIETEGPLGLYVRNACKALKMPFTTSLHGQHHLYAKVWLGNLFEKLVKGLAVWFHRPSKAVLVATDAMRAQLLSFGLQDVYVRPLGVSDHFFNGGKCPSEFSKPVFVFMGRISSEKSVEEFLRADLSGTKLVIGDGPDRKKLERSYPSAIFVGYKTGEELVAWLSCADVMVMPSRTETFGLTIVEGLAAGLPVAAHEVMGPREIIRNGENGFLEEDISVAAKKCLSLSKEKCRESAKKYSWNASADTFISILERVRR